MTPEGSGATCRPAEGWDATRRALLSHADGAAEGEGAVRRIHHTLKSPARYFGRQQVCGIINQLGAGEGGSRRRTSCGRARARAHPGSCQHALVGDAATPIVGIGGVKRSARCRQPARRQHRRRGVQYDAMRHALSTLLPPCAPQPAARAAGTRPSELACRRTTRSTCSEPARAAIPFPTRTSVDCR